MPSAREFIKGISAVLPEIPKPERKPSINERLLWTAMALVVYLVMAVTPLYGFGGPGNQADQLAFLRVVFASSQGTLMELGIGPIVTAGLILQLLVGSEIIKLDMSDPEDRAVFGSATKFLTLIVIIGEAAAYIVGGALGVLSTKQAFIIFFQLFAASLVVLLLDEMIQKGWGIGSGISLFILAGVAQTVMWYTFSPQIVQAAPNSTQTVVFGFVPALISSISSGNVTSIFIRNFQFPSLLTFILTIVMILVLVYIEGIRVEIPITSARYRGFQGVYPIKLLYVSNIPVILVSALAANITFFTRMLYNLSGGNPSGWLKWLGEWNNPQSPSTPTSGLVYYITAPQGIAQTLSDPVRSVVYVIFLVGMSVLFAKLWVEIGGLNPRAVAKNLIDAQVMVPGFRRANLSLEQMLNRYIPILTIIGGIIIGLIASISDLFGVFGSGIGILLMVDITLQYYQMLLKEQIEEYSPRLAAVLGAK